MTISFTIPGDPVPFARAGAQGKRRFTPRKQADYMAAVKLFASQAMAGRNPIGGPVRMEVVAMYVAPSSWSEKKRAAAKWRTARPDVDNLAKLAGDSINGIVFVDDAQVVSLEVMKCYGPRSEVRVTIEELA